MTSNYEIEFTKFAAKKYAKLCKNNKALQKQISKAFENLSVNPFFPSLNTHIVNIASYDGKVYSSFISGDIRIIWKFSNGSLHILVLNIGGHSGTNNVYR
jgi:mRNA-degrading endonuclease RelE of RelBE toxin-antitoxin system